MPPARFSTSSFDFLEGQPVPDHVDEYVSSGDPLDPTKFHINGHDTFEGEDYGLARDIDDEPTALALVEAAERQIERDQPSETAGDIQDTVTLIRPTEISEAQAARIREAQQQVEEALRPRPTIE